MRPRIRAQRPRWQSTIARRSYGDVLVVIGGTIRTTAPFIRAVGIACGPRVDSCDSGAPMTGTILFDRHGTTRAAASVVLAHEFGHLGGAAVTRSCREPAG